MPGNPDPLIVPADQEGIARAVAILRAGGLVALPTETVYGLAARADSVEAVARIYRAKGRPAINPLIVHAASLPARSGWRGSTTWRATLPSGTGQVR